MKPLIWAMCSAGLSRSALAGLSVLHVLSQPGQPFKAVLSIKDEVLPPSAHVELADRNNYPELGTYSASVGKLRFTLIKKESGVPYYVMVDGPTQFEEQELAFAVEISWPEGRLAREYRVTPGRAPSTPDPGSNDDKTKKVGPHVKPSGNPPDILLGEVKLQSRQGEFLQAEIEVSGQRLDQGKLTADVDLANGMEIQSDWIRREPGLAVLRLTSQQVVDQSTLDFKLQVSHDEAQVSKVYSLPMVQVRPVQAKAVHRYRALRYKIRRGDTLSAISRQLISRGHPVHSVMHWLVRHNPAAFVHDNPSRMLAGATLRYPVKWGRIKARLTHRSEHAAASAGEKEKPSTPAIEPALPTLQKVAPEASQSKPEQAASAAQYRVLDEQRRRMTAHIQQQDKQLAQLQSEARRLEDQLDKLQHAKSPVRLKESTPSPHPGSAPVSQAGHAWTPLEEGAVAAAGLVTAMGLIAMWNRRRHSGVAEPEPENEMLSEPNGQQGTAEPPEQAERVPEQVNWLAQADTYMREGRYDQAVGVLRAGLALMPERQDLRYKLLLLHLQQGELPAFLAEAEAILDRFGRESSVGKRVVDLGRTVMPGDPLFGSVEEVADVALQEAPRSEPMSEPMLELPLETASMLPGEAAAEPVSEAPMAEQTPAVEPESIPVPVSAPLPDAEVEQQMPEQAQGLQDFIDNAGAEPEAVPTPVSVSLPESVVEQPAQELALDLPDFLNVAEPTPEAPLESAEAQDSSLEIPPENIHTAKTTLVEAPPADEEPLAREVPPAVVEEPARVTPSVSPAFSRPPPPVYDEAQQQEYLSALFAEMGERSGTEIPLARSSVLDGES